VPAQATVIYDDDCGFCRWSLALLLNRDPGALRPLPLGTPEADYLLAGLNIDERYASWHLVIDPPGPEQLSFDPRPVRFSAGTAFAPALSLLPRGRRIASVVARIPGPTERGYRWVAGHRGLLGRFVSGRAREWADGVIAAHGGPPRPQ
jgi:predicted DCC family thiol-disulfide oxidoreductase YuxK